jgi:UDP-glucuronate decarboxylase
MYMSFSKKKVLVAGGAGFIGSHLCERLLNNNVEVICLDNFSSGYSNNLNHLLSNNNFSLVAHDIVNPFNTVVDEIYNLACPASPVKYQSDPIKTTETSVIGAINLLNLAKKTNAKILQASTSEVYGDPLIHPQIESYWGNVNPVGIRSCYDEGKRCAETLFFDYYRQHKVRIKVVRIFNTYGPKMDSNDGRVVSNFINQALNNKNITIYGSGTQTRSFCYIDDLVNALMLMMDSKDIVIGPVNLGNPVEFTIQELAEIVIDLTNSNSKIVRMQLPSDDPRQRQPDISLAKSILGWCPEIDLMTGIKKTISYFQEVNPA